MAGSCRYKDAVHRTGIAVSPYWRTNARRENGYIESFNGQLRDELLNGEIFETLLEAKVLIERWRVEYNTIHPHTSLGYRPLSPEARQPHFRYAPATVCG